MRWLFSSDDYWLISTDEKWLESPDANKIKIDRQAGGQLSCLIYTVCFR